jgi:hypothetical protein
MVHERFGVDGERWTTGRGRLEIEEPAPGVVLTRFAGHAELAHAEAIVRRFDEALARTPTLRVFDDWEAGEGYESEVRVRLTEFTRTRGARIASTHVLIRSKLFAMGLSVANLALGGRLHVTASRADFEAALRAALGRDRERRRA